MEDDFTPDEGGKRIRVAKLIALRGLASRRGAEQLIESGEVLVNGQVVLEQGSTVDPSKDTIRVEGRLLPREEPKKTYILYKPRGCVVGTADERGRKTTSELVGHLGVRVMPVGRLDFDVEGALLLTSDGDLVRGLLHPSNEVPRRYAVKCYRTPSDEDLKALKRGVHFSDGTRAKPVKTRVMDQTDGDNAWLEVTLTENGPRLVQRLMAQLGHPVSKLRRESFATISIRGLERGDVRELTFDELQRVQDVARGIDPRKAGHNWRKPGFARPKGDRRENARAAAREQDRTRSFEDA